MDAREEANRESGTARESVDRQFHSSPMLTPRVARESFLSGIAPFARSVDPSTSVRRSTAINALVEALRDELGLAIRASRDAGEYATDEESKAESKWDTQGLESSYLAAGQAAQAEAIAEAIQALEKLAGESPDPDAPIGVGSLFECDWGDATDWFLLVSARGGTTAKVGKGEFTAITSESPIGKAVVGKKPGDRIPLPSGRRGTVRSVAR